MTRRPSRRPSRRAVLQAGLALPLAACTNGPPEPAPPPDPDLALRALAAERERALLEVYDASAVAAPELAARLAPLRAAHAEHLRLLGPLEPAATPAPAASVPKLAAGTVLDSLRVAEQYAGQQHAQGALGASRELAALLASLAACEASHAVALA